MEEKGIHFSQELIGELLDKISNAVIVIDSESRIVFVNIRTEQMFGVTADELLGSTISQLFMPEDADILVDNILSITRREGAFEVEAMLKRFDGSGFLGMIAVSLFNYDDSLG